MSEKFTNNTSENMVKEIRDSRLEEFPDWLKSQLFIEILEMKKG